MITKRELMQIIERVRAANERYRDFNLEEALKDLDYLMERVS